MTDRRKLLRLHVIARSGQQDGKLKSTETHGEFDSGRWTTTEAFAEQAIGAELHLHERRADQSWKAGTIISWKPSDLPGRVMFRFRLDPQLHRTQTECWGMEQARVWEEV